MEDISQWVKDLISILGACFGWSLMAFCIMFIVLGCFVLFKTEEMKKNFVRSLPQEQRDLIDFYNRIRYTHTKKSYIDWIKDEDSPGSDN